MNQGDQNKLMIEEQGPCKATHPTVVDLISLWNRASSEKNSSGSWCLKALEFKSSGNQTFKVEELRLERELEKRR